MEVKALLLVDEPEDKIRIGSIHLSDPGESEVRIKVIAAALNHRDQWCRQGMYPALQYGGALGSDACGTVVGVGKGVNESWLGKKVILNPNIDWGNNPEVQSTQYHILGMPSNGTFSEYVNIPVDRIHEKPGHLSENQAVALPLAGLTAYRAIFRKGRVDSGQNILVTGIGGGVSQFAFLFGQAIGANIYVTSGNEEKLTSAIKFGAVNGYNYKEPDWHKKALKDSGGFDVIIDSAGGNSMNTYLKLIKPGGRMVHYGSTSGVPEKLDIFRLFWSQASIHGTSMLSLIHI